MECPKCGYEIDEKALVCPNCKKVLKLICPVCKTVNSSNTCKRCGYVIITKCHNCGKINQTANKKCKKCGFSTEESVILNEANTDDFAMLVLNFPNIDNIRKVLGSNQLFNRFKGNLDTIINEICKNKKVRRQLYKGTYVIRFDKDYSFKSSVENSIKTSIELFNRILTMNAKLSVRKNSYVKCNAFLVKRNVNDDPNNIDVGYNINLLHEQTSEDEQKILNTYQLIADSDIADILGNTYPVSVLTNSFAEGEVKTFFEVDISESLKFDLPQEFDEQEIEIPNFVQNMLIEQESLEEKANNEIIKANDPDAIYDIETINFDELRCAFIRTESVDLPFYLLNALQAYPNNIIGIRAGDIYKPYSINIVNTVEQANLYSNIITVACYDEMKYSPYAFFTTLISKIFEYSVSSKLFVNNDYSVFENIDKDGLIKELVSMSANINGDVTKVRFDYFNIFLTLFQAIPNSMIIIEDFDKMDSSSYEVMKYLFKSFEQMKISCILTYDKNYAPHKDMHFLLNTPYYTEIMLKPASFEKLISDNKQAYKNIMDSFYFQRIAKYACGSNLYLDTAVQYLLEAGVFKVRKNVVEISNEETIIIPSSLEKLVERRINLLQDDGNATKLLLAMVLLGSYVDMNTLQLLNMPETDRCLTKLQDKGFIYVYNNSVNFPNYRTLRKSLLKVISPIYLKETAILMLEKLFRPDVPSIIKTYLYKVLDKSQEEFNEWKTLSDISLRVGDFSSYLNCAQKVLDNLENIKTEENFQEIETQQAKICVDISENMLEYLPEKSKDIADNALAKLESGHNVEGVINLCNKMIQGNMRRGYYMNALELSHKIMALLPPSALSPNLPNFNQYFYMMSLLHIQILFNIGALDESMNVGYRVLSEVNDSSIELLKPEAYNIEDFEHIIVDSFAYVALVNILMLQGNIQQFLELTRSSYSKIPSSYAIFIQLEALIHGFNVDVEMFKDEEDFFAQIIYNFIKAFTLKAKTSSEFAQYIYRAKLYAHEANFHCIELFADLMIAYSYIMKENYVKAKDIIYKIIKEVNNKGITIVLYAAWLLLSDIYLKLGKYQTVYGIVNNSLIQLEKSSSTSDYLIMLFKYRMYKVMMHMNEFEKAQICITQARYIANKYGIQFTFEEEPMSSSSEINVPEEDSVETELDKNLQDILKEREDL